MILPAEIRPYRGMIALEPPGFAHSIYEAYSFQCSVPGGVRFYLPRHQPEDAGLIQALRQADCMPRASPF